MASRRMLSRSIGTSEKYAALIERENGLADFCHALFPLLIVNSDDVGRLQGDAFTIKHSVFPISHHSISEFEDALLALHRVGLIARYMSDLRWYIQIINFEPHQPGLLKTIKTQLPGPDAAAREHIRQFSRFPANSRESGKVRESAGSLPRIPSKEGRKEGRSRSGYYQDLDVLKDPANKQEPPIVPLLGGRSKKRPKRPNATEKRNLAMMKRWGRA